MSKEIVTLYAQDDQPSGSHTSEPSELNDIWFQPSTSKWYHYDGNSWVEIPPLTELPSLHVTGDLTFDSNLYAGEKKGINGNIDIPGVGKLKFHKGILYKVGED
uniref:Uncharacterized protein n=1 Tax=viral metagenome TaxID=1070528 RepID=A0A6M3J1W6_9ZZZZ